MTYYLKLCCFNDSHHEKSLTEHNITLNLMQQNTYSQFGEWIFSLITACMMLLLVSLPFIRSDIGIYEQTSTKLVFQIRFVGWRVLSLFFAGFPFVIAILSIGSIFFIPDLTPEIALFAFGFGLFFSIITFLILAIVPFSNYTFDKQANSVTISTYKCFHTKVIQHPLSEVVGLEVEEASNDSDKVYRFNLKLESGNNLPLTECYRGFSYQEKQFIIKIIETFINSN
jgi:hypothetical protein